MTLSLGVSQSSVLRVQGSYYLLTGLWPVVHFASFEAITGPKVDDWLVHMVGLLAAVIGVALLIAGRRGTWTREIFVLATGSALAFAAIDIWYGLRGRIAPVYLADGVVELAVVLLLVYGAAPNPRSARVTRRSG